MKNSLKSLVAVLAFAGLSVAAYAQAPKVLVVDFNAAFNNHYQTIDYRGKLQADQQKAAEEAGKLEQEIIKLDEEYKKFLKENGVAGVQQDGQIVMDPKFPMPSFASEDKKKQMLETLQKDTITRLQTLMTKDEERKQFGEQTKATLQQRMQTFRTVMLEQINKAAVEMAKRKGAFILLEKSGTAIIGGVPAVLYVDASLDITEELLKELNKDRPASAPATAVPATTTTGQTAAPAATPAPATDSSPKIQLPGSPVKK